MGTDSGARPYLGRWKVNRVSMNRISALLLACIFTPQLLAAQVQSPSVRFPALVSGQQSPVLNHEPVFGVDPTRFGVAVGVWNSSWSPKVVSSLYR